MTTFSTGQVLTADELNAAFAAIPAGPAGPPGPAGSSDFTQSGTGAVTRPATDKLKETVSVKDFGAVGDGVTDDLAAFNAAIASFSAYDNGIYGNGGTITVPPGNYKLSGTLWIDRTVQIVGGSSPYPYSEGVSKLTFTNAGDGVIIGWFQGTYVTPSGKFGSGAVLKNLFITTTATTGTGNGIVMNTKASLEGLYVRAFRGHGVYVYAVAPDHGNANNFQISNCKFYDNLKCGLFVDGPDVNAGVIIGTDASLNGEWGIYDSSFLGNTYVGCHTANNTLGAYKSDDVNAANVFVGCYSESGQPPSQIDTPALIIGGMHAAGFDAGHSAVYLASKNGKLLTSGLRAEGVSGSTTLSAGLGGNWSNGDILYADESVNHPDAWRLKFSSTDIIFNYANLDSAVAFYITGPNAPWTFGRSTPVPYAFLANNLWIGSSFSGARRHETASAAPISGEWARGDIVYNNAPTAGGFAGWICTTAGTPGTWKTFGAISA